MFFVFVFNKYYNNTKKDIIVIVLYVYALRKTFPIIIHLRITLKQNQQKTIVTYLTLRNYLYALYTVRVCTYLSLKLYVSNTYIQQ